MSTDRDRAFWRWLLAITLVGLGIRVALAGWYEGHTAVSGDGLYYLSVARFIGKGVGFVEPIQYLGLHRRTPTAIHPPLYPLVLSVMDLLGFHGSLAHRLWSSLTSVITIPLVGVVAKMLAGRRAGLVAASCATFAISLAVQDVLLWSEGLYVMLTIVTVWCAYRLLQRPSVRNVVFLAAAICASALTRAEASLLIAFLLVPLVYRVSSGRDRVRYAVAAVATIVVVFVPWTAYNSTRFDRPVVMSTGLGPLLWSANCDSTYHGPNLGGWGFVCSREHSRFSTDESVADGQEAAVGWRYVTAHTDRLPTVIGTRLARTFGVWHPSSLARQDLFLDEADLRWLSKGVVLQYWTLLAVGGYGLVVLRRRGKSILPLVAPMATVVVMTVVGYGTFRFRAGVDAILPIPAGLGAVAAVDGWRTRRRIASGIVV